MAIETNARPVGTGQAGAGTPAGVDKEIPVHVEGHKPADKLDQIADKSARKGIDREHRADATEFTK